MGNSSSEQAEQVNEKDIQHPIEILLQVVSQGGISILDEHTELVSHLRRCPETNLDGSAEAQGDFQDKSSLSISGTDHIETMEILHIAAPYINKKGINSQTPLHTSAMTGDTDLVDIFLKAGANVNAEDEYKQTPLHYSVKQSDQEIVETLLKAGANINAEDEYNLTPLHYSVKRYDSKMVETLLNEGANVDAEDKYKQTPLHYSVKNRDKEIVETLLKAKANVDAEDENKQTPLHYSIEQCDKEMVTFFIKEGANVNVEDKNKRTPLHYSVHQCDIEMVEICLKAGANVDAKDACKQTPLHYSVYRRDKEIVETLLEAGANVDAEDEIKQIPLHISIICKHDDITNILLRAGASVEKRDNCGRTSLDYMDGQKIRLEPTTLFKLCNLKYYLTNNKKHLQSSTSEKTKTEHTETTTDFGSGTPEESYTFSYWDTRFILIDDNSVIFIDDRGVIFIDDSRFTPSEDIKVIPVKNSSNNGDGDTSKNSFILLHSEKSLRSAVGPQSSCRPLSPEEESHDRDDNNLQKLNIRQVENLLAKYVQDSQNAFQAGRIVMPPTINITHNKITRNINHRYEPGTNLHIGHAENVAPGGHIVVYQNSKVTADNDEGDSSSEDDSFGENDSSIYQ